MSYIKTNRTPRMYWLVYAGAGESVNGVTQETPTLSLCINRKVSSFLTEKIKDFKDNPFGSGRFPCKFFALKKVAPVSRYGFRSVGMLIAPPTNDDPYVIKFEIPKPKPKPEDSKDFEDELAAIVNTLSVLLFILNEYIEKKTRHHEGELSIPESQQLCIGISDKLLTCHLGAALHNFLSAKSETSLRDIPKKMKKLWQYMRPDDQSDRFDIWIDSGSSGNMMLTVPGQGTCCLHLHSDSGREVTKKDVGYSLMSKNVDHYWQLITLLAGMAEIYFLFQGEQEQHEFSLELTNKFEG